MEITNRRMKNFLNDKSIPPKYPSKVFVSIKMPNKNVMKCWNVSMSGSLKMSAGLITKTVRI